MAPTFALQSASFAAAAPVPVQQSLEVDQLVYQDPAIFGLIYRLCCDDDFPHQKTASPVRSLSLNSATLNQAHISRT